MTPVPASWSAIVLAGGRGARLGGAVKASVEFEGRPLLAHALDAVHEAHRVVVVGEELATERPVTFTRERPAYGGPVAGLLAGLDQLDALDALDAQDAAARPAGQLVVLAVDMPRVTASTVTRLRAAATGHDGAILVDPDGRRQLALALSADRLRGVRPDPADRHGMPLRRLLAPLDLAEVAGHGHEHRDIDTWADLHLRDVIRTGCPGDPTV